MTDERFVLPPKPEPEPSQLREHPRTERLATAALVVAALSVLFACWQASEARRARLAADKSVTSADRSAAAAERSAAAAEGTLSAMVDQFKFEQRADPSIIDWRVTRWPDGKVRVSMTISNAGKSAAVDLRHEMHITVDNRIVAQHQPDDAISRSLGLGVYMHNNFELEAQLPATAWAAIDSGKSRLAVHLIVSYGDLVGNGRKKAGWCREYRPREQDLGGVCIAASPHGDHAAEGN